MLTAVKIASLVSIAGPLDGLVADLKIFPQKIVNVRVRSKPSLDSLARGCPAAAASRKDAWQIPVESFCDIPAPNLWLA